MEGTPTECGASDAWDDLLRYFVPNQSERIPRWADSVDVYSSILRSVNGQR